MSNLTAPGFVCGVEISVDDANAKGHGLAGLKERRQEGNPPRSPR